ncbi:glycosyltransferase family 2 protein [Methanoculleus sp.]|uniref:glycosyltransferase family 2 protein n=1 Tax=Methanoculleus sp. TaxID=90427 RepID=UPI0025FC69DC|nr:glycosyltransferase family 2 protein [Methanoculleus sp.]
MSTCVTASPTARTTGEIVRHGSNRRERTHLHTGVTSCDSGKQPWQQAIASRTLAAIIPAYNEGLVIGSVVLQAQQHVDRVIVIDDGSTDRTAEIARLAGADVIEMLDNGGKAKAMTAGFARAREIGFEAVVMLDGDGQHDPAEIPAVVAPVLAGEADLVIGSRFLDTGVKIPKYRVAGQKVLNGFTNLSTDGEFVTTDSQSGFRALSRRALDNLNFASEGYTIESDMIAHFASINLRMTEVPISVTYDVPHKHKKNPISHGFGVLARIVGLIGYKRPLLSFSVPGFLIALTGICAETYTYSEYYRTAQFHYIVFIGGVAALTLGLLLVTSGLILNSLVSIIPPSNSSWRTPMASWHRVSVMRPLSQ